MISGDQARGAQRRTILLADDHEMLLEVFTLFLEGTKQFDVTTAKNHEEAVGLIQSSGPFDLSLLDWNMPKMYGLNGLKRAIQLSEGRPVAIFTGEVTPKIVDEIVTVGASGIVLKTSGVRSLVNAINTMISGERYMPFDLHVQRGVKAEQEESNELTAREKAVLIEISKGKRNKEICSDLRLALPTVKMHVSHICRKLGAQNRLHATVIGRDLGIL